MIIIYQKKESFWWVSYKHAYSKDVSEKQKWVLRDTEWYLFWQCESSAIRIMQSEMSLWAGTSGNHLNLLLKAELKVIQGPFKQNVQFLVLSHGSEMHSCVLRWTVLLKEKKTKQVRVFKSLLWKPCRALERAVHGIRTIGPH